MREYGTGNSENTVLFIKYLQSLNIGAIILIFLEGASYHKYGEMGDYLSLVNQDLEISEWPIICELFAPNAPEQNPVEDIWLQGKNLLRQHWHLCKSFSLIKKLFMFIAHWETFDFSNLNMYGFFPKKSEFITT